MPVELIMARRQYGSGDGQDIRLAVPRRNECRNDRAGSGDVQPGSRHYAQQGENSDAEHDVRQNFLSPIFVNPSGRDYYEAKNRRAIVLTPASQP